MSNGRDDYIYHLKECFLTKTEQKYLLTIQPLVPQGYYVQPQVNLASIIIKDKVEGNKFQNELYRNVDFCIFDLNHKPAVLIEINDSSHNEKKQIARDQKVKCICEEAGIPLIRFWTSYGINPDYMQKKIHEAIEQSKAPVRIAHHKSKSNEEQKGNERQNAPGKKTGCYIATCVYGSYDSPEVLVLRRYRDYTLARTWYGRMFIRAYYVISPLLVRHFGEKKWFKTLWERKLNKMVARLSSEDEQE